ncbi:MAG: DUF5329 family protein [Bacteroidia bacterium]
MISRIFSALLLVLFCLIGNNIWAQTRDKAEQKKIEYLIDFIRKSNLTFIRNEQEFSGIAAAEHLEMKLSKAGSRIQTANDFIDRIASQSILTKKPYQVKLKNGSVINLRDLLYFELNKLNKQNQ